MKRASLAVAVIISFMSFNLFAAGNQSVKMTTPSTIGSTAKNINAGNIEVGGSASLSTNAGITWLSLAPSVEYFVMRALSIGGTFSYYTANDYRSLGLGPSATWYFYEQGPLAFYGNQVLSINSETVSGTTRSTTNGVTGAGLRFFLDPHVALGAGLSATYRVAGDTTYSSATTYRMLADFHIYF